VVRSVVRRSMGSVHLGADPSLDSLHCRGRRLGGRRSHSGRTGAGRGKASKVPRGDARRWRGGPRSREGTALRATRIAVSPLPSAALRGSRRSPRGTLLSCGRCAVSHDRRRAAHRGPASNRLTSCGQIANRRHSRSDHERIQPTYRAVIYCCAAQERHVTNPHKSAPIRTKSRDSATEIWEKKRRPARPWRSGPSLGRKRQSHGRSRKLSSSCRHDSTARRARPPKNAFLTDKFLVSSPFLLRICAK